VPAFTVTQSGRLDAILAAAQPERSRTKWAEAIAAGSVTVDGVAETKTGCKVEAGQTIAFETEPEPALHDLTPADIALDIRYEDDDLLVVNKPRGLASHPAATLKSPSLVNALLARGSSLSSVGGSFRPGIVHRLDKATTGLMVVAKNDRAHAALAKQFETREAGRIYVGIVAGRVERERFDIDAGIGRDPKNRQRMAVDLKGRTAKTRCAVLGRLPEGTLMAFKLDTGRTHQIRVHLRAIGHPVLGDDLYAPKELREGPLQLHAAVLEFRHPVSGEAVRVFAEPPEDFRSPNEAKVDNFAVLFQKEAN
jgi:23S rRNA pseudouridine1911/1915/1917 synthase